MNSGNLSPNQTNNETETEKQPLAPQEEPLLTNDSSKGVQNTITSIDSALSNSDKCSDIELGKPDVKTIPK